MAEPDYKLELGRLNCLLIELKHKQTNCYSTKLIFSLKAGKYLIKRKNEMILCFSWKSKLEMCDEPNVDVVVSCQ